MRVDVSPRQLEVTPGLAQALTVTIANTETVIAGYAIRVLGADPSWVELDADDLALFPDETRTVTVTLAPPKGISAGTRRVAIQVRELTPPFESLVTEVDISVPATPIVQVRLDPLAVTAGKRATFTLLVENSGNTEIKGVLSGDDPESQVRFAFDPDRVVLAPGQHAVVDMRAAAKRHFLGTPTVRTLSVYLDPVPDDAFFNPPPKLPPASGDEREAVAGGTFIQKSVMSRGALSLLGLLLAATVFAIVITIAMSRLVAQSTADRNLALQVAAARNSPTATGQSGMSGTVTLLTSGKPVPGVAVSVFNASDTSTAIATTATDAKGAYRVTDLPAGKYKLSFRGAGFVQIWYPSAATDSDAVTVTLAADQVQGGLNVSLGGVPASISGTVVGDDVSAATLFLETEPSGAAPASASSRRLGLEPVAPPTPPDNGGAVVKQVPIGSDGSFSLTNVPSPSVYNLVVVKTGYATTTQRIDIGAGETRTGVQLTLSKGDGLISGTVTSLTGPLGGATITATSGVQSANTISLSGTGAFTLRALPTPATFTVVAKAAGFASQALTLSLGSGQKLTGVAITLSKSSTTLHGLVTLLPKHTPAAGVGVTVTDGRLTVQTATESADHVGTWSVGGLPVPGTYTVTFARSDLQSQTVSVSLDSSGNPTPGSLGARTTAAGITVSMQSATATVSGTINQPGGATVCNAHTHALGEASVSFSSGSTTYAVTSASVAPNCGGYRIEQLPPGTYTMTVSAGSGTSPSSQVITVDAGQMLVKNVQLPRPASIIGRVVGCKVQEKAVNCDHWSVFLYDQARYPMTADVMVTTDAGGNFTLDQLGAGSYILAAGPTSDPANAVVTKQVTLGPSDTVGSQKKPLLVTVTQ